MDPMYEPLFRPWRVGKLEIKNRVVMLPMEGTNMIQWEAKRGFVKGIEELYRDRKDQNIGLFIPGLIPLISIVGKKWVYRHPEVFEPVKPIVKEIHDSGAKIFFQISAGSGRSMLLPPILRPFVKKGLLKTLASLVIMSKWWWSAPDPDEPNVWDPEVAMDHFTEDMIRQFVYAFGQTALRCKEAGVDGVEIHAVHEGYLLDQFAMPYTNHRQDAYGGSLENRLRFACEIVREIKKVCGPDYPVSLRYSVRSMTRGFNQGAVPGEDFTEAGRTMEESERAIRILEAAGYDLFNCDNGTYDAWYWAHPPVYAPLNLNLADVEHIKKFTTKPVVCAGRMQPEAAAAAIARGGIDAMGVGRPEEIAFLYRMGYSLFDCVIPSREARHMRLYAFLPGQDTAEGVTREDGKFYRFVYIMDEAYTRDFSPIDPTCDCPVCRKYSKAFLQHLFRVGDSAAMRLATIHNLRFYSRLMEKLGEAL